INNETLNRLAADIEKISPRPHHSALLEIASRLLPDCVFKVALSRGGWYRQGGVIEADGTRIAETGDAWGKVQADDVGLLLERYADQGLLVTRHTGRTHYLVAPYGPAPVDFLQLEVEELQEVLDRKLIDPDHLPDDIQDIIEPVLSALIDAQPVGAPCYRFRRLIDMRQIVARISFANGRNGGLPRLIADWSHSSAAVRGHFSDHWIVSLREHQDRYRNPQVSASLVSRHARELKSFQWNQEAVGVDMSMQLQAFDRAAGYISAWYFHLVAGTITPPKIAYAVVRDLDAGFSYPPDTEVALIRSWVVSPYSV
ncbi:MAG: hypothetical protein A3J87_00550, partial [Sideroxydans sp. RIFOXYB12_FULL_59_6]